MLMWLDSRLARRLLAEIQESANFITEICERTVVDRLFFVFTNQHTIIISYYDTLVWGEIEYLEVHLGIKRKLVRTTGETPLERATHNRQISDRTFRAIASLRCESEFRSR